MKGKNVIRLLILVPLLLMVLIGCGKKAPPTPPKEPSSLIKFIHLKVPKVLKVIDCEFRPQLNRKDKGI